MIPPQYSETPTVSPDYTGLVHPQYSETPTVSPDYTGLVYPQQPVQPGMGPNAGQAYIVNQPAQIGYVNGCNQIVHTCSPAPVVYNEYNSCQSKFLGVAQILVGIMCIAFNAAAIGVLSYTGHFNGSIISHGIWGGIFFIITGSFGIAAASKKTRGFIITFMVLCIISALVAVLILMFEAVNIPSASNCYFRYYTNKDWYCPTLLAMSSLLVILSVFEGAFVLWGSIISCKVACCCGCDKRLYVCNVQPQPVMLGSMNGNPQIIILTSPNVMSQPIPNAGYSMVTAPIHPTTQSVTMKVRGMDSSTEGKSNPVFQVD